MAWTPPSAGELRQRVRFEARAQTAGDGYGNTEGDWEVIVSDRRVRLLPVRGGEAVQADRLAGLSAWTLDVPADTLVRTVAPQMRVVDCRDPTRTWDVKSVLDLEGRDRWRTMTLEMGGSDG
ncbi:phage head completion protein [Caulobacter sp.]|uniref:phage head completion protein n=1 Tax=Caulobacter sp. TaxID=78 RepID=UPI003BB1C563